MTDHSSAGHDPAPDTTPVDLFDPVGHVVLAFGNAHDADVARDSLLDGGYAEADLVRYRSAEVTMRADRTDTDRTIFSYLREEHELAEDYEAIARAGGSFLLVRAQTAAEADRIATVGRRGDLKRASHYGPLTFTDLR